MPPPLSLLPDRPVAEVGPEVEVGAGADTALAAQVPPLPQVGELGVQEVVALASPPLPQGEALPHGTGAAEAAEALAPEVGTPILPLPNLQPLSAAGEGNSQ